MVNYQDGKIYQLINDVNSKVYIGSTCQTLCKRMSCHRSYGKGLINKSPIYLAMHDIGVEHFRIILIQEAPCQSKEELLAIEYNVARQYQQRGTILYNATGMATITDGIRAKMRKSQCMKGSVRQDGYSSGSSWRFHWREDDSEFIDELKARLKKLANDV